MASFDDNDQELLGRQQSPDVQNHGVHQAAAYRIPRKPVPSATNYQAVPLEEYGNSSKASHSPSRPCEAPSNNKPSLLSLWWQETLSCGLMIGSFLAIIAILLAVQGNPLPKLRFHVSVNTLIAIFATILKVAAAFVLAEGLSQSKWAWYTKPRQLHDFLVYDNASRGPWGALQLLWYLRCRPLIASLGAFVTIAATLIDPLTQQLIKLHDCEEVVLGEVASVPRTRLFDEYGEHVGAALSQMSTAFIGSLASGQFADSLPQPPFTCSSGNCTFEHEYSSVGYCSSCVDVSDRVVYDNYTYKDDYTYFNITVVLKAENPDDNDVLSFQARDCDSQGTRFSQTYNRGLHMLWYNDIGPNAIMPNGTEPWAYAVECTFSTCVHTFQAEVVKGILKEETLSRGPALGDIVDSPGYMASSSVDLSCVDRQVLEDLRDVGYIIDDDASWLKYNVTVNPEIQERAPGRYSTYSGILSAGQPSDAGKLKGFYSGSGSNWTLSEAGLRIVPQECIYQSLYLVETSMDFLYFNEYFQGNVTDSFYCTATLGPMIPTSVFEAGAVDIYPSGSYEQVQELMQNITDSMTTYMRWHGNANMSEPVLGVVKRYAVCISVRWGYISYSASIVTLVLLFFIAMVINTRYAQDSASRPRDKHSEASTRHDFKSSALATLFHGLDPQSLNNLQDLGKTNTVSELEAASKQQLVMLLLTQSGWKLSHAHEERDIAKSQK